MKDIGHGWQNMVTADQNMVTADRTWSRLTELSDQFNRVKWILKKNSKVFSMSPIIFNCTQNLCCLVKLHKFACKYNYTASFKMVLIHLTNISTFPCLLNYC